MNYRGLIPDVGRALLFDGAAQLFDSIPVEHAPDAGLLMVQAPHADLRAHVRSNLPVSMRVRAPVFVPAVVTPALVAALVVRPRPSLLRRIAPRPAQHVITPPPDPTVAPIGPTGPVIVMNVQNGATVTHEWATDVIVNTKGSENRIMLSDRPRERYSFRFAFLDKYLGGFLASLDEAVAQGEVFLLGLEHEGMTITSVSSGATVGVTSTANHEWCTPGQRVVVLYEVDDGSAPGEYAFVLATIQSVGPTSIALDASVGFTGVVGSTIMPARAVVLESTQRFGGYASSASEWDVSARAVFFPPFSTPGGGWTVFGPLDELVFDMRNEADSIVARALDAGATIIDRGGAITAFGQRNVSNWTREVRVTLRTRADYQKFRACTQYGRLLQFWLPTWRDDFPGWSGDLTTSQFTFPRPWTTSGITSPFGTDYVGSFHAYGRHAWLQFTMSDGTVTYEHVFDAVDNGDGTQTIVLDNPVVGTVLMISMMERCRWDSDVFEFRWEDGRCHVETQAIVVQR